MFLRDAHGAVLGGKLRVYLRFLISLWVGLDGSLPPGRAVVGAISAPLLLGAGDALVYTAGWHSKSHDAHGGRPYLLLPLLPMWREEALGWGHFDQVGEPQVAWLVWGDDRGPRA